MADIANTPMFGRIKFYGVKSPIDFEADNMRQLVTMLVTHMHKQSQFRGEATFTFDTKPLTEKESDDPIGDELRANAQSHDEYMATLEGDEFELQSILIQGMESDASPEQIAETKLIQEYRQLSRYEYRMTKSREHTAYVKTTIESRYAGRASMIMWNLGGEWWQI